MSDVIQLGISADGSELVAELTDQREELKETESAFQRFGNACVSAMTYAGNATIAVVRQVSGELHAFATGALGAFGQEVGKYAGKMLLYGSATAATTSLLGSFWSTMRVGLSAASWFLPWLKVVTVSLAAVSVATYAYRAADESLNGGLTKSIVHVAQTSKALDELKDAGSQAGISLQNLGNDLLAVGAAAVSSVVDLSGVGEAFNIIDEMAGTVLHELAGQVSLWADGVQIITDATMDWAEGNDGASASLRNMAAASEALIAKQEAQADMFGQLRAMQEAAADAAQHAGELQRLASLTTVDAVNAEILALQQKTAAVILAGEATEESQKKAAALFATLEGQRGKIADNDKAAALREELEATKAINAAKEEQRRLNESAADHIARLQDQIDLMSGAATKAEIAIREMLRAGMSQEQAQEIGRLTEELNKLQEAERLSKEVTKEKTDPIAKADRTMLKAAFAGSSEAASIALRGVGGGGKDPIPEKQLGVQQQMLIAIKANKPPTLTPLSL